MKGKIYSTTHYRSRLVAFDIAQTILAALAFATSFIGRALIRVPDALVVLNLILVISLLFALDGLSNIIKYYSKRDDLYHLIETR